MFIHTSKFTWLSKFGNPEIAYNHIAHVIDMVIGDKLSPVLIYYECLTTQKFELSIYSQSIVNWI